MSRPATLTAPLARRVEMLAIPPHAFNRVPAGRAGGIVLAARQLDAPVVRQIQLAPGRVIVGSWPVRPHRPGRKANRVQMSVFAYQRLDKRLAGSAVDDEAARHHVVKPLLAIGNADHDEADKQGQDRNDLSKVPARGFGKGDGIPVQIGDLDPQRHFTERGLSG